MITINSKCMSFTASNTGGEYTHKLTVNEMPSHKHGTPLNEYYASITNTNTGFGASKVSNPMIGTQSGFGTSNVGGDQSHNNIQPYIVVYFWRRTA